MSHQAFFSFKFKYGGLCYETGINIQTGDLCWVNGPFPPGDWLDIEIFHHGLKGLLDENEHVKTDDGYIGEDPYCRKCPGGVCYREDRHWSNKRNNVGNHGETLNH